jgi:hypothetical protein
MVRRRASADGSLRPIDDKIAIFAFMAAMHNVQIWYSPTVVCRALKSQNG